MQSEDVMLPGTGMVFGFKTESSAGATCKPPERWPQGRASGVGFQLSVDYDYDVLRTKYQ